MPDDPPKVFISYNRADRDWAEWIAGVIERGGYQTHYPSVAFSTGGRLRSEDAAGGDRK
jgi:hypothetical protein